MTITATDVSVAVNGDIRWDVWDDITTYMFQNGNTSAWTDDTVDANNATTDDVTLAPVQITSAGDVSYFGSTNKFSLVQVKYSTPASITGGTSDWEYWNGTAWTSLTITDPTSKFTAAADTYELSFTPPDAWEYTTINSIEGFYIRLNYSAAPSVITTAPLGDEFELNIGAGSGPYTVLELHRFLQNLADAPDSSGDDLLDIVSSTPSERSTDNIITLNSPYNIDDCMAEHIYDGSVTQAGGDDQYSGLEVVGSVNLTTTLQVIQAGKKYYGEDPFWGTGMEADPTELVLSRMMIKSREGGADINGKRILVVAREFKDSYAEFPVTLGLGIAVAAISTVDDINNNTDASTVSGWTGITNTEGHQAIDLLNGNGEFDYYAKWDYGSYTVTQVYERTKWLSRRGSTSTLYGFTDDGILFRGITHSVQYDNQDASEYFEENEILTWATGTGRILADTEEGVDAGTTGTVYIQLLTGVAPTDGQQIADETGCNADVDTNITPRTVSPQFFGQATGTAIIGAYGICIDPTDGGQYDSFTPLVGVAQSPPNNQDFIVYGLASGEDYVLVTWDDTGIDVDQHTTTATYNTPGVTSIAVSPAIYADTPKTGTIRIQLDDGRYRKIAYTDWTGSTFTIGSTDFSDPDDSTSGNNLFVSYIDKVATGGSEQVTLQYATDRTMFIRVRDGGGTPIKTYESTSPFTDAGGSATASRVSDE